jgi:hypothetical protein
VESEDSLVDFIVGQPERDYTSLLKEYSFRAVDFEDGAKS